MGKHVLSPTVFGGQCNGMGVRVWIEFAWRLHWRCVGSGCCPHWQWQQPQQQQQQAIKFRKIACIFVAFCCCCDRNHEKRHKARALFLVSCIADRGIQTTTTTATKSGSNTCCNKHWRLTIKRRNRNAMQQTQCCKLQQQTHRNAKARPQAQRRLTAGAWLWAIKGDFKTPPHPTPPPKYFLKCAFFKRFALYTERIFRFLGNSNIYEKLNIKH